MKKINMNLVKQKSTHIEKALRFIEKNMEKSLTLTEIAKESGMSKYYFSRTFKVSIGRSFKQYLTEKRIDRAKSLLANKDLNITEVCFLVGFNDLAYFDRVFRQKEGVTPSAFRKQSQLKNSY